MLEDGGGVDAGDDDGDGLSEAVVQGFDGLDGFAVEDVVVAEGLHGEDADALLERDGDDFAGEGAEVGVHDVDGHLDGVEVEAVLLGGFEHAQVDGGVFVAGEADVADLPACLAATAASMAPPGAKMRSGSSMRMTSWNWTRSMVSVWRRPRDCSSCLL